MPDAQAPDVLKDPIESPPDEGAATVPDGQLALAVEAILLTVDRPVSVGRLAEALGLAGSHNQPATGESAEQPDEAPDEPKPKRSGRKPRAKTGSSGDSAEATVRRCVDALNDTYAATGRSFRVADVAGGYRLMTLPEFAPAVAAFHRARQSGRLSRAAIETLAIIAYRQPITRAHLEAVRGVACGEVLRSLMERRLVTIKGRAEELGRPILYGTTKEFLDAFGLGSLKDLPTVAELQPGP